MFSVLQNNSKNKVHIVVYLSCFISKKKKNSYCSYARLALPGPIKRLGPLRSDSVLKLLSVLFGTLVVTKCWPMETRLSCGDQWKAENLGAFWRWPIIRCFFKSDKAGLIIENSINIRVNGEHWRAMQYIAFWRRPITRCFFKSDRAGLIIEHSLNFRLIGELQYMFISRFFLYYFDQNFYNACFFVTGVNWTSNSSCSTSFSAAGNKGLPLPLLWSAMRKRGRR